MPSFETFAISFTTLFVTIGPIDVAIMFLVLSENHPHPFRLMLISLLTAMTILFSFAFIGEPLLGFLGISVPALQIGGGILLLLIAIELVFRAHSDTISVGKEEENEAINRGNDIAIFPIAVPLLAGPASITSIIILMANTKGDIINKTQVILGMFMVLLVCLFCMLLSRQIKRILRKTGLNIITRLTGVFLTALAVQFIINGIVATNLLGN